MSEKRAPFQVVIYDFEIEELCRYWAEIYWVSRYDSWGEQSNDSTEISKQTFARKRLDYFSSLLLKERVNEIFETVRKELISDEDYAKIERGEPPEEGR